MAIGTTSGLFVATWLDILDLTQLAVDFDAETHKCAMYTNTLTPNYSTDTSYSSAPYNANQVTGTAYVAGGAALTGTTITESPAGTLMWDATDVAWAASTIANARGALLYADALGGKNCIALVSFGNDYSTTNGTFTIQWATTGILTLDITP